MITYNGIELGPLLEEDKALLKAIILMTAPKNVVEFGFLRGESARTMLSVMGEDAKLTSYDLDAPNTMTNESRLTLIHASQENFEPMENVDFVFLDASHDFELNKKTFEKIQSSLTPNAIIAVHDTGKWFANVFEFHIGYEHEGGWLHCPDERKFVNWVKEAYPNYQQIHFNTQDKISHGITLLQNYYPLTF
jgi:hypothetical protein